MTTRRILAVLIMFAVAIASIWLIDRRVQRSVAEHGTAAPPIAQPSDEAVQ